MNARRLELIAAERWRSVDGRSLVAAESAFVRSFREQMERLLAEHRRVRHRWAPCRGGWAHLEVPPDGPTGFSVHANVGPDYAIVLASRTLITEFPAHDPWEEPTADRRAGDVVEFVAALLGPATRIRERRAGRATYHWLLECQAPGSWRRLARWWSPALWNYVGRRCEVVYQNRYIRPPRVLADETAIPVAGPRSGRW
jgi:hypothetical protein